MRRVQLVALASILWATAGISADTTGLVYIPAVQIGRGYGMAIALARKDQLLFHPKRTLANEAMAVIDASYDNTVYKLEQVVEKQYGITKRMRESIPLSLSTGELKLSKTSLESGRYNILSKKRWSSFLVKVFDGKPVLGRPSAIITFARHDTIIEFGFGHNLIPAYRNFGRTLVTPTEVELISEACGTKRCRFFDAESIDYLDLSSDSLEKARVWLEDEAVSNWNLPAKK